MSYEWLKDRHDLEDETSFQASQQRPATKEQLQGLCEHLEEALDARNYFPFRRQKAEIGENLRAVLTRPSFTESEIQVLRGVILRSTVSRGKIRVLRSSARA